MTVKELSETVKTLIGEYDYFDIEEFIAAANTALGTLYSEGRFIGRASLYLSSPKILKHIEFLRHKGGETELVTLSGTAYSMRVFGKGTIKIRDGNSTVIKSFNGWDTMICGTVKHGGRMEFSGAFSYTVKDIALFSEYEGEDIPVLGKTRSIRISSFVPDFSRIYSYPKDGHGNPLSDVRIEDGYIICPNNFSGELCFSYKKRPPRISADVPNFEIPITPDTESPLALLTAAYILGEAEIEAAEFFLKEYKRSVFSAKNSSLPSYAEAYFDTTGWA